MLTMAQIISIIVLVLVASVVVTSVTSIISAKKRKGKVSVAQVAVCLLFSAVLLGMFILIASFGNSHPIAESEKPPTHTTEPSISPAISPEPVEVEEFTFEDLSRRQFEFSSGAGAWSENFTIEKDGYFTGLFHDSDMGDTGEEYADGTVYSSSYSGHFADLTKINEYTYQMKLADITYKETPDTEEISDNLRHIYTDSYCLSDTDTFLVYLPGTPVSELSEDVWMWIRMANQSETELTMMVIADIINGYGIYSRERLSTLEDAQLTYNSYMESYEYYKEMLSESTTTLDMVKASREMFILSDDCLNYIWNLIRYNVSEEQFQEILEEQNAWITEKEIKAKEAADLYQGGSLAGINRGVTLAELNMKRCEALMEYLK